VSDVLKAPFPWFGGKSRAASLIWPRFGAVVNYVEPFAGSLAVLLARPGEPSNEIVNDLDCYVANAWRAIKFSPSEVAAYCDWPVNEADLHARHTWLHGRKEFRERMKVDPDFYDARVAGFWIWGLSCWIGANFCRPRPQEALPHLTGGKGVARKVPHLTGGKGDRGVNALRLRDGAQSSSPDGRSRCGAQSQNLLDWFSILSNRLRFTKIVCGDWSRVLTKASTYGQGLTAVLLDPPYDADGHDDVYGEMSRGLSKPVREWAISNGSNPLLRIALCGYAGEHTFPDDWDCVEWKAMGGYAAAAGHGENSQRERIWFSPHCLAPKQKELI
jgi:site-specific DNA-adenine methylase